jgi:hypothetical protein
MSYKFNLFIPPHPEGGGEYTVLSKIKNRKEKKITMKEEVLCKVMQNQSVPKTF